MSYQVKKAGEGLTLAGSEREYDFYKVTDTDREMIYHVWYVNHPIGKELVVITNQQTKAEVHPGGATHTAIVEAVAEHNTPAPEPEPDPEEG